MHLVYQGEGKTKDAELCEDDASKHFIMQAGQENHMLLKGTCGEHGFLQQCILRRPNVLAFCVLEILPPGNTDCFQARTTLQSQFSRKRLAKSWQPLMTRVTVNTVLLHAAEMCAYKQPWGFAAARGVKWRYAKAQRALRCARALMPIKRRNMLHPHCDDYV